MKTILNDIETVVGEGVGKEILSRIRNTMSDRHVVQKFNVLLEEYRTEILPEVETRWSRLSEEEKESLSTLNNFFCGMHLVVGLVDTAASTLMEWEDLQFKEPVGAAAISGAIASSKESGTVRLIRTACKAF